MKKTLALVLCMVMLLGMLAACGGNAAESPSPEVESAAIRWSGGVVGNGESVVAIVPTLQAESVVEWSEVWQSEMEAAGYKASLVSAETTVDKYVTLIEDYTQQGVVAMFIAPMDSDAIQDAVETAMAQGIVVIFLGAASENYDPDGGVMTDYYYTGYGAVELAVHWLKNEASLDTSSPIPVAINTYYDNVNGAGRSQGYKDAIADNSGLLSEGYEQAFYTSTEEGYTFAQNAMTANPDIRIFVCYEADTARGVDSYLMGEYLPAHPELSAEDFLTVSAYYDATAVENLDAAEADPSSSTFRAYVTYGAGNTETGWAVAYVHLNLLSGTEKAPFWFYDNVSSRTTWAGEGIYTKSYDY